jgi:hypothetical protein
MRKVFLIFLYLLLLLIGGSGLWNGPDETKTARSPQEAMVGISEIVYGVGGIVTAIGLWFRRSWTFIAAILTSAACMFAAATASVIFGETSWTAGAVAGLGAAATMLPVVMGVRYFLGSELRHQN